MNKLAYMRTKRGLTQKRLFKLTGLSIQSISNYECGYLKLEKTTYKKVKLLADILHCGVSDIVEGDYEMPTQQDMVEAGSEQRKIILSKNPNYYEKNQSFFKLLANAQKNRNKSVFMDKFILAMTALEVPIVESSKFLVTEEGFNEYCSSFLLGLMSENK